MIGGTDIVIPAKGGHAPLDLCLRIIGRYWPAAVFEDALTGQHYDRYELVPISRLTEMLVYKNSVAANEWEQKGADPSLENTMIHLLRGENTLTVVVDNPQQHPMKELLDSIRFALASPNGLNNATSAPEGHADKSKMHPE